MLKTTLRMCARQGMDVTFPCQRADRVTWSFLAQSHVGIPCISFPRQDPAPVRLLSPWHINWKTALQHFAWALHILLVDWGGLLVMRISHQRGKWEGVKMTALLSSIRFRMQSATTSFWILTSCWQSYPMSCEEYLTCQLMLARPPVYGHVELLLTAWSSNIDI